MKSAFRSCFHKTCLLFVLVILFLFFSPISSFWGDYPKRAIGLPSEVNISETPILNASCHRKLSALRFSSMENGLALPISFQTKIKKYLDTHIDLLWGSNEEERLLTFYISSESFLREDLLYVGYADGDEYRGEALLKLIFSKERGVGTKVLWDSRI